LKSERFQRTTLLIIAHEEMKATVKKVMLLVPIITWYTAKRRVSRSSRRKTEVTLQLKANASVCK